MASLVRNLGVAARLEAGEPDVARAGRPNALVARVVDRHRPSHRPRVSRWVRRSRGGPLRRRRRDAARTGREQSFTMPSATMRRRPCRRDARDAGFRPAASFERERRRPRSLRSGPGDALCAGSPERIGAAARHGARRTRPADRAQDRGEAQDELRAEAARRRQPRRGDPRFDSECGRRRSARRSVEDGAAAPRMRMA